MDSFHHLLLLLLSLSIFTSSATTFPKEALPTKSGYLPITTTITTTSSALFYAFYEAQHPTSPPADTPLLIWLQGGPGCSSMIGNFYELGPYLISPNHSTLHPNPSSWNRLFGLLFIDNPIGTGFSIAAASSDIPRNQSTVAEHLFIAIQSFLSSNPSFRNRPLYLTGESYAGKYVPAIGYHILQKNPGLTKLRRINLRGVAIGNGLTHPITQVGTHAASAYFTGLINDKQRAELEALQTDTIELTRERNWPEATDARNRLLDWMETTTGTATLYDWRRKKPYEFELGGFLTGEEAKKALGVANGSVWESCSEAVGGALHEDVMKSMKFAVEGLLRKSRVLLYQGIFDLRDGVVSTEAWLKEVEWEGMAAFVEAERRVWEVNGETAGYVQRWGSLTHAIVMGAGHLVPTDQGPNSQAMIEDWVQENGLFRNAGGSRKAALSSRRSY